MPNPPAVAELILRGLLPLDMAETVSGDLLEEYRESRVPAAGEFRADLWYWQQVGGMWLRAYWWLVASAACFLVVHDVFNLDGQPKLVHAMLSPLGLVAVIALATAYGSGRAQRWQGGLVAALGVSAIVWLFMAVRDGIADMLIPGIVLLGASLFFGGIAALIGEILFPPASLRARRIISGALICLGVSLLVVIGLTGPHVAPPAEVALFAATGAPPLDFEAPHDGQVVAHMDLMRGLPPDIARIRISEVATGATVWDVKPAPALRVCWNGCWNLTLSAGPNPASFAAGRQHFKASVPQAPAFSLTPGRPYLFEVWDSKGRVTRRGFTL